MTGALASASSRVHGAWGTAVRTMRGPSEIFHLYGLVGAFALVAAVFLGAAGLAQHAVSRIDRDVADLQENSLPSVRHLMSARTSLRKLRAEVATDERTGADARAALARIRDIRASLDADLLQYDDTPAYYAERVVREQELKPALDDFDVELSRVLGVMDRAGGAVGRNDFREVAVDSDDLDEALADLGEINHAESYAATARILGERHRSTRIALILDLVSSAVAFLAAWLAIRSSTRYQRLLRAHAGLQEARAGELDAFAAQVAHDLQSPMSVVAAALGLIAQQHHDADTTRSLERARRAVARSGTMVRKMLELAQAGARPAPGRRARLGEAVRAAVDEIVDAEPASAPEVRVDLAEDCEVACDAAVLGVILSNLLGNAVKFMRGAPVRRVVVRGRVAGDGERAHIEVEDTGPGLPADAEKRVFEPYARAVGANVPGLGLGLATVARLVRGHGGTVGARGGGPGALLWLELPISRATGG